MTNKIILATPPDDTLIDGLRILHIQLNPEQSQLVSNALMKSNIQLSIINYIWKIGDPLDWMMDKKIKSDIILFNPDPDIESDLIIGYIAAQSKSYYINSSRNLSPINNRAIYTVDDLVDLINNTALNYE